MKYRHKHQIVRSNGVAIEGVIAKVVAGSDTPYRSLLSIVQELAQVLTPAQQRQLADKLGYEEVTE